MTEISAIKVGSGIYEISFFTNNHKHYEAALSFARNLIEEKSETSKEYRKWIAGMDGSYMCPVCNNVFRYEIGCFCSNCGSELQMR